MYEVFVTERPPNPPEVYQAAKPLPPPQWRVIKARTKRVQERFGDLQRHPWVGERQAGRAVNLYNTTSRAVDAELRAVPYGERLRMPAGGAFPLVQGLEIGTGPNPWLETPWLQQPASDARSHGYKEHRGDMRHDRLTDDPPPPYILENTGAEVAPGYYADGPASDYVKPARPPGLGPNVKNAKIAKNGKEIRDATNWEKFTYKIDSTLPVMAYKGASWGIKAGAALTGNPYVIAGGVAAGSAVEKGGKRLHHQALENQYGHLRL